MYYNNVMKIWAIADLHLSFATPDKKMDVFGEKWRDHATRIRENWINCVGPDDLVLLAGDHSWAMKLEQALEDLKWIARLPGKKFLTRGNHDYWWSSISKIRANLPENMYAIQNDALDINGISIGGARLWDSDEYHFNDYIAFQENPRENKERVIQEELQEKIFKRELQRLETSLSQLNPKSKLKIAMVHYPPIGVDMKSSKASKILEKYHIDVCVFGHLHQIKSPLNFGTKNGVTYFLTSCDYLDFNPLLIKEI